MLKDFLKPRNQSSTTNLHKQAIKIFLLGAAVILHKLLLETSYYDKQALLVQRYLFSSIV